jgi:hypothetical protein
MNNYSGAGRGNGTAIGALKTLHSTFGHWQNKRYSEVLVTSHTSCMVHCTTLNRIGTTTLPTKTRNTIFVQNKTVSAVLLMHARTLRWLYKI